MPASSQSSRVIRDPVYGYVELPDVLAPVVAHPLYQRLRRVSQTSLTAIVYPSATGSRFEHGLGAMHLARRAWHAAVSNAPEGVRDAFGEAMSVEIEVPYHAFETTLADAVGGVALLHDLGHPPFSHVLEDLFRELAWQWFDLSRELPDNATVARKRIHSQIGDRQAPFHEAASRVLVEQIMDDVRDRVPDVVRRLILRIDSARPTGSSWASTLHSIVAGELDVDRLDYLMRDAQKAGTEFGAIDYDRLIDALELHQDASGGFHIAPGTRARSAVETLLLQRTQSYRWIIFHPLVVGSNLALARATELLSETARGRDNGLDVSWDEMNYLDPGETALDLVAKVPSGEADTPAREPSSAVKLVLQAGVDDAALVQKLKRSMVQAILDGESSETIDPDDPSIRLGTYAQAALLRKRSFVPAWKTIDEFRGAVHQMMEAGLADKVEGIFSRLIERYAEEPDVLTALRTECRSFLTAMDLDAVVGVNAILRPLVTGRAGQRSLCDALRKSDPNFDAGFLDATFASFQPVRNRRNLTVLYDRGEKVQLRATSPLVRALERVEQHRIQFFLYFFVCLPAGREDWEPYRLNVGTDVVRGAFLAVFPEWMESAWELLLINLIESGEFPPKDV